MNRKLVMDTLGWGLILWVIGYILGIVFFFFLPASAIGWVIMPIGLVITFWVLLTKISSKELNDHLILAVAWTVIAVLLDYVFIVRMLNPEGGYYKPDVYLYYGLTFASPLIAALWKRR